jgi:hypothetical protein
LKLEDRTDICHGASVTERIGCSPCRPL